MMIHVVKDINSKIRATVRVTASPWVQTWTRPVVASWGSMGRDLSKDEKTGTNEVAYSSTKSSGMLNHMASGTPARLPGT
jgi:hypothetical protein